MGPNFFMTCIYFQNFKLGSSYFPYECTQQIKRFTLLKVYDHHITPCHLHDCSNFFPLLQHLYAIFDLNMRVSNLLYLHWCVFCDIIWSQHQRK
uniref:Putative ovule protein n=1 Tax=Solanum chacoense TaxID=4108 RepID=A0A0V0GZH9_SOLCH